MEFRREDSVFVFEFHLEYFWRSGLVPIDLDDTIAHIERLALKTAIRCVIYYYCLVCASL